MFRRSGSSKTPEPCRSSARHFHRSQATLARGATTFDWYAPTRPCSALLLHERTFAFRQRSKCVVARNGLNDLDKVPRTLRLGRRLYLDEIHIVHHTAILADVATGGKDVVYRRCPHFPQNGERPIGAAIFDGLQIMAHGRIRSSLNLRWHCIHPLEETVRPFSSFGRPIVMECHGCVIALSEFGSDCLHLVEHHLHRCDPYARLPKVELGRLLD